VEVAYEKVAKKVEEKGVTVPDKGEMLKLRGYT
jgi:hypothetical protein